MDGFCQLRGMNDLGVAAPCHHPTLHLEEARQTHSQFNAAVLEITLLLCRMPFFLTNVVGNQFVESDYDILLLVASYDGEAASQPLLNREALR